MKETEAYSARNVKVSYWKFWLTSLESLLRELGQLIKAENLAFGDKIPVW